MHLRLRILALLLLSYNFLISQQNKQGPIRVEVRQENNGWQLYRGGKPYYIKGVGGQVQLDKAVAYGANSVRTWGVEEAAKILDEAQSKGLTVLFGLWVGCERQGFDYNDSKGVQAQLEAFTEVVKTYKDHPALLMWGIGNETDLFYSDFKVWNAINDIAKMIHEIDPNHPTMTVTAGLDVAEVQLIKERAPHIDIYGINTYAALIGIDKEMRSYGWEKPYIITEWGPSGHWEVPKTSWGVPIEQTSTEKAFLYKERYEKGIAADREMCIGSYVFLWGQKQETTPTWYGVFLEDGSETEVTDVLQYVWSGAYPSNRAPTIHSLKMNNKTAIESIYLRPGKFYTMEVEASDWEGDSLHFKWEMLPESRDIKTGGDAESRPEPLAIRNKESEKPGILNFKAPTKEGPYRLFVYISDGKGKTAVANIPFYSKSEL
jgi:hypothetical protein